MWDSWDLWSGLLSSAGDMLCSKVKPENMMLFGVAVPWQKSISLRVEPWKTLGLLKQHLQTVLFSCFYTFTDRLDPHEGWFLWYFWLPWWRCRPSVQSWNWGIRLGSHSCTRRESQQTTTYWPGSLVVQQPGLKIEPKLLELLNSLTMFVNICGSLFGHLPKPDNPICVRDSAWKHFFGWVWLKPNWWVISGTRFPLRTNPSFLKAQCLHGIWHKAYVVASALGSNPLTGTYWDRDNLTFEESQTKQHRATAFTLSLQTLGSPTSK